MQAVEAISSLIADMYDAALDSSRWGSVIENSAKYVAGPDAKLWLEIAEIAPQRHHFNPRDYWQKRLTTQLEQSGPAPRSSGRTLTGNVFFHMDAASPAERLETRICDNPIPPGSTVGSARCVARFALSRPAQDDSWIEVAQRRLKLIFPHLRRAVQICKTIATNRAAVAALEDTLDGLDAGIFLVNALGQMVDVNSSGNAMLRQGGLAGSARGKLLAYGRQPALSARLMPGKSRGAAASVSHALQEHGQAIDSIRYVARAFSIAAAGEGHDDRDRHPVAGVILHEAGLPTEGSVERISRHYRLALRERQVLEAIVDGSGVTQIAQRLAIAHSTAKTYLSRLFEKTGTKNQTDLIKLCAAFRSPFSGSPDAR